MKRFFSLTVSLSMILGLFLVATSAFSQEPEPCDIIGVPATGVSAKIDQVGVEFCDNVPTTFKVRIKNGPLKDNYLGWCIEPFVTAADGNVSVDMSLLGNDAVDWLLNHLGDYQSPDYCVWHKQWAIWILGGLSVSGTPPQDWNLLEQEDREKILIDIVEAAEAAVENGYTAWLW